MDKLVWKFLWKLKTDKLLLELKREVRSDFELKLADRISAISARLDSVHHVSAVFADAMRIHREFVIKQFNINPKIREDLFSLKKSGRLNESEESNSHEELLEHILTLLESRDTSLDQIMNLHSILGYRVIPHLIDNSSYTTAHTFLEEALLKDRGRLHPPAVAASADARVTNHKGFNLCPFFTAKAGSLGYKWEHGRHVHTPDEASLFTASLKAEAIPFVAGPSGHTLTLVLAAQHYAGLQDPLALNEYLLACFSFLARGGHHSFHEVMVIAQGMGLAPYETGQYLPSIAPELQDKLGLKRLFDTDDSPVFGI